ncbi:Zinc finger BED domain-containing protein DAYSLEEPER [Linum grandiflorum]
MEAIDENYQLVPVAEDIKPPRRRKQKSHVWEYFTVESVDAGCKRAFCNHCRKSFAYSMGSKVAGTSHLKRHIEKGTCGVVPYNGGDQPTPVTPKIRKSVRESRKRRYRSPGSAYAGFNADNSRHDIARMIIMHDYPLDMVEHPGFVSFVQSLQPRFSPVSFNTIQGECVASYLGEKHKVMQLIQSIPGLVCLSLDLWMSRDSLGYVFITAHFTDSSWKTQKWVLNVVLEPYPDSHTALSHAVACCLSEWRLENKLLSLTLNHAVPEAGLENLRSHLCVKNPRILNGQLLLGKCISHTFTSMVKDVLLAGRDIIKKIRDNIKYVTTSESHEEKFFELKQQLQVPSEVGLFLDDQSQWNTTYQMLMSASDLKEVFSCLDTVIPEYKAAPSMEEWKQVEIICSYLKSFFDATNMIISSTYPPAVTLFQEALRIQAQIACSATSADPFTCSFIKSMQEKLDHYWKECGLVLAVSVVMDPRFKMKLVEFSFKKIFGQVESCLYIKMVDDGLHQLFDEYLTLVIPPTPTYHNHENMDRTDFDAYIMETSTQQLKSEIDQYLDESLVARGPDMDIDVLEWWRQNKLKYPTLAKMARDILSIPVSTVAPESVYSTTPRELSLHMSSVKPEILEALVCTKDWLQHGLTDEDVAVDNFATDPSIAELKMEI